MRGRVPGLAAGIVGLAGPLLVAGCATPEGIDRDLTGDWRPMPSAVGWVPEVGACHQGDYQTASSLIGYQPVDCQSGHLTETVHVGEFTQEAAERVTPPPDGAAEWRTAYQECDEAAADYLGTDFRHGHLWMGVTVPSVAGWEGGARWFRCEVLEIDVDTNELQTRVESLAGVLAGESDLLLRCFEAETPDPDQVDRLIPTGCGEPHDAEFVGTWVAPDVPYLDQEDEDSHEQVHRGCLEEVAGYVDVPVDGNLQFRSGTITFGMREEEWDRGDRAFRCFLWLDDEDLTRSLKGTGTDGLPIR